MELRLLKAFCKPWRYVRRVSELVGLNLDKRSFLVLHYLWFIGTCLLASIILWSTSTKLRPLKYLDALFLTTSAMSQAGLTPVGLSTLTTFHQAILFVLIFIGSSAFVSSAVIQVRKHTFEAKLQLLVGTRHLEIKRLQDTAQRHLSTSDCRYARLQTDIQDALSLRDLTGFDLEDFQGNLRENPTSDTSNQDSDSMSTSSLLRPGPTQSSPLTRSSFGPQYPKQFVADSIQAYSEQNAPFSSFSFRSQWLRKNQRGRSHSVKKTLSNNERDRMGGIEYRALRLMAWIVPLYVFCFPLFGCIGCGTYLHFKRPDVAMANDLNSFWTGAFYAVSAFGNNGMALNDANMSALQTSYYTLMTLGLLILAGNTCFPPFLRLVLWLLKVCLQQNKGSARMQEWCRTLKYILDHPRRVYTHLFPSEATWWLVLSLIVLNGIDWLTFEVLNVTNPAITDIPLNLRVLDGLFQAFAVRKGGFFVVPILQLYPGTLVMYIIIMYINALPIRTAITTTGEYEDQSLEITSGEEIATVTSHAEGGPVLQPIKSPRAFMFFRNHQGQMMTTTQPQQVSDGEQRQVISKGRLRFLQDQLYGHLTQDLWWIALAVLFITIIETASVRRYPEVFSIFNIAFEVVSGWGTVGISAGVPWDVSSFCGAWHTGSKLILTITMLRGRHVGLPEAIDRTIVLPETSLAWSRAQDVRIECECGHHAGTTITSPEDGPSSPVAAYCSTPADAITTF